MLCKKQSIFVRPKVVIISLRTVVAKVKIIEYCFHRVKPSKARRVASALLESTMSTDYATMAELDEREKVHHIKTKGTHKVYLLKYKQYMLSATRSAPCIASTKPILLRYHSHSWGVSHLAFSKR